MYLYYFCIAAGLVYCIVGFHSVDFIFKPGAHRPQAGAPGFLKLILCGLSVCVRVCVYPHLRLLITSGVMWRDIDLI